MFSNMKIGRRLLLLISTLTLIFIITGTITLLGLNSASNATGQLNITIEEGVHLSQLATIVHNGYVKASTDLYLGNITWKDAANRIQQGKVNFNSNWKEHLDEMDTDTKELTNDLFSQPVNNLLEGFDLLLDIAKREKRGLLTLFMLNDSNPLSEPFLNAVQASLHLEQQTSTEMVEQAEADSNNYLLVSLAVILGGLFLAVTLGLLVYRSITAPISKIASTVTELTSGNMDARTEIRGRNELGELGQAFDGLLNERLATVIQAEKENERLNDSIIDLLEGVSILSERDLSVLIPVAEDVTGPVADAMNMMASETAQVLKNIRDISDQVEESANSINTQGHRVTDVAAKERKIVQATMEKLEEATNTMGDIAKQSQSCNEIADMASKSTAEALTSVNNTAEGMNDIRETISETEKRIKRLGERSQEITGVVQIINNIAERTHVLSLNASMQAASAGEAGRGFAVVADEVQRLAESSRDSTAEIQALVSNIQTETAETMVTMNKTITQVVEGTELAQRSGEQMKLTQKTTFDLAAAVEKIAERSLKQAEMSSSLREQATEIVSHTQETSKELEEQSKNTLNIVEFAKRLLESVRVFKLPE